MIWNSIFAVASLPCWYKIALHTVIFDKQTNGRLTYKLDYGGKICQARRSDPTFLAGDGGIDLI